MVVAGPGLTSVFVANAATASLQVLELADSLGHSRLVPAPARFHPLAIPSGPGPGALAASPDGAFVFVASATAGSLRVIDAAAYQPLEVSGSAGGGHDFQLGTSAAGLGALLASPRGCPNLTDCIARLYVARAEPPQIEVVEVFSDPAGRAAGQVSLRAAAPLSLPSTAQHPTDLALWRPPSEASALPAGADERLLVATDDGHVVSIDLRAGVQVAQAAVLVAAGGPGPQAVGPLRVAGDGSLLVVARPNLQDVVVLTLAAESVGGPAPGLDPLLTPLPTALGPCAMSASHPLLATAHPADRALCSDANGVLLRPGAAYRAIYLGGTPRQLIAMPGGRPPMRGLWGPTDGQDAPASGILGQAMAVALADGHIAMLALRDDHGDFVGQVLTAPAPGAEAGVLPAPVASLLTHNFSGPAVPAFGDLLSPCDDGLSGANGRRRLLCLGSETVAWVPGALGGAGTAAKPVTRQRITLRWEGVVAQGTAVLAPDGSRLDDLAAQLTEVDVQVGDTLVITATPRAQPGPNCAAAAAAAGVAAAAATAAGGEAAGFCHRERQVAGVLGTTSLLLDAPLVADCYPSAAGLTYQVRARKVFVAHRSHPTHATGLAAQSSPVAKKNTVRVQLGDAVGLGSRALPDSAMGFVLGRPELSPKNGCDVYASDGHVLAGAGQSPLLSRGGSLAVEVVDGIAPQRLARLTQGQLGILGPAGELPSGMALVGPFGSDPQTTTLAISYAGSDRVALLRLSDLTLPPAALAEPVRVRVLD